jgi:hypothetical protein
MGDNNSNTNTHRINRFNSNVFPLGPRRDMEVICFDRRHNHTNQQVIGKKHAANRQNVIENKQIHHAA